jgi:CheY-like chemotaxis protein
LSAIVPQPVAGSRRDGLVKLKTDPHIKLVVADVNMPNMDRLTMVERTSERGGSYMVLRLELLNKSVSLRRNFRGICFRVSRHQYQQIRSLLEAKRGVQRPAGLTSSDLEKAYKSKYATNDSADRDETFDAKIASARYGAAEKAVR